MSRSEVSKSPTLELPPPPPQTQSQSGAGTASVDAVSNADCPDCCKETGIQMIPFNLPGKGATYLNESFAPKVQAFIDNAKKENVDLEFISGYRTQNQQTGLPGTTKYPVAENSLHSCGCAVDVKDYADLPAEQQRIIRKAAEDAGLEWGGSFKDPPHFFDKDLPFNDDPHRINRKKAIQCAKQQLNNIKK